MAKVEHVSLDEVIGYFDELQDPRSSINQKHPLISVLVIALMAVLAGAGGPTAIARWAKEKAEFLHKVLDLPHGIPCKDVFRLAQINTAGTGESHVLTTTLQQRDAQFRFELTNLLAKRWLRSMQARCRASEIQFLGYSHKIFKMPQLHTLNLDDACHFASCVCFARSSANTSSRTAGANASSTFPGCPPWNPG